MDGVEAESPESRSDVVDVVGEVAARGEGGGGGAVALAVDVVPARAEELIGRDVLAGLARPVEGALGPPAWGRAEGRRVSRDGLGMGGDGGEGGGWVGACTFAAERGDEGGAARHGAACCGTRVELRSPLERGEGVLVPHLHHTWGAHGLGQWEGSRGVWKRGGVASAHSSEGSDGEGNEGKGEQG